jgi:NCS1 family nucleobase:cation symporter-1
MALAYLAINIASNCLPFGSDLSALFPRWMTIRRGQVLCTILGVCIVPWKLVNSAKAFISFVSGYGYFLAPIAGCLAVDYFYQKKGNLVLKDLWRGEPDGRYYYWRGWNMRAVTVTVLSLLPCLPSFAATLDPNRLGMSLEAQRLFYISFTLTYFLAATMYALSYVVFPEKNLHVKERTLKWEQYANELDADEANAAANFEAEAGKLPDEFETKYEMPVEARVVELPGR